MSLQALILLWYYGHKWQGVMWKLEKFTEEIYDTISGILSYTKHFTFSTSGKLLWQRSLKSALETCV